ncbi:MAG: VOC family protein, partial [Vicinamibacterales bacterium]
MTLPDDAHVGQVSLTVRDLDRSVSFYRDVLGLTETASPRDAAGSTAIALGAPGGRGL